MQSEGGVTKALAAEALANVWAENSVSCGDAFLHTDCLRQLMMLSMSVQFTETERRRALDALGLLFANVSQARFDQWFDPF